MEELGRDTLERPRRNVGRVEDLVLACRTRDARDEARDRFTELVALADWDDLGEIEAGGDAVLISWACGIEVMCPTWPGSTIERHLDERGGFYALVFGVADLDETAARAERVGVRPRPLPPPPQGVLDRFQLAREANLDPIGGLNVLYGEFATTESGTDPGAGQTP